MDKPRCNKHKDLETLPVLCHTCQRINVEHLIVTKLVDTLLEKQYELFDLDDRNSSLCKLGEHPQRRDLLGTLFDLDEAYLGVRGNGKEGWISLVFGNDGYDVISDYTTNIEEDIQSVNDYADTFDV